MAIADVNVRVGADIKQFQRQMRLVTRQFNEVAASLRSTSDMIRNSISLPFAAASAAGAKFASDVEAELIKINTLVGVSGEAFADMRRSIEQLSDATGKSRKELAQAGFVIQSAGLRGKEALDLLAASAKASVVGLGDQAAIARASTAVMQAYADQNMTAGQSVDMLTAIVREGNLEASEIAPAIGKVLPVAKALNVSFEEVGANIAVFTRLGVSAAESVTALRSTLAAILKPTEDAKKELATYGITFDELREKLRSDGLLSVLQDLNTMTNGNVESLGRIIPSVEALADVLGTAGAQGESYVQVLASIQNAVGIVDRGFATASQGSAFKYQQTMNDLKNAAITLGEAMIPVFEKIAGVVRNVAQRFQEMDAAQRDNLIQITALVAASPVLLSAFSVLSSTLGSLAKMSANTLLPALKNIATAVASGSPLMLGLLATGVVVGVVVVYWEEFKQAVEKVTTAVHNYVKENDAARTAVKILSGTYIALTEYLKLTWKQFVMTAKVIHEFNKSLIGLDFSGFGDKVKEITGGAAQDWIEMKDNIIASISEMNKHIDENSTPIITADAIQSKVDSISNSIKNTVQGVEDAFADLFSGGSVISQIEQPLVAVSVAVKGLSMDMENLGQVNADILKKMKASFVEVEEGVHQLREHWAKVWEEMGQITEFALANMLGDLVTGFASAMAGFTTMEDVFKNIGNQLANLLEMLGKTAIYKGLIEGTLKYLFAGNPAGTVAIGVGALAMAGVIRGMSNRGSQTGIPAFANGALVTGPMLAMVGDNKNAARDPEAILPVSKLQGYIKGAMGNGGGGELYGRLSGNDLLIANDRNAYRMKRITGRS